MKSLTLVVLTGNKRIRGKEDKRNIPDIRMFSVLETRKMLATENEKALHFMKGQNNRGLLVIDLQRWFLEVGSEEKLSRVSKLIENTNQLIKYFDTNNQPIFKVQTVHKADKSTWNQWALDNNIGRLIEGTREAEYSPDILITKNDQIVTKTRLSAFLRTDLESRLKGLNIRELIICGYSIDNCVGQTAIDAYEYDFRVTLAGDAILGTTIKHGELMLESLNRRFGILSKSNEEIIEMINTENQCQDQ